MPREEHQQRSTRSLRSDKGNKGHSSNREAPMCFPLSLFIWRELGVKVGREEGPSIFRDEYKHGDPRPGALVRFCACWCVGAGSCVCVCVWM
jgi:hypothetical protein